MPRSNGDNLRLSTILIVAFVATARGGEFPVVEGPPPGFEVVRLTNGGFQVFSSIPDINDRGEVTWAHFTPPFESSVYVYRDGVVTRVTDGTLYEDGSTLDNEGRMAWRRGPTRPTANDLYIADWDAVVFTGASPLSWPKDNDVGQLVWDTTLKDNSNVCEIFEFTRTTGAWRQVSSEGLSSQEPKINNAGVIVWTTLDFSKNPWQSRILMDDHGVLTNLTQGVGQRQGPHLNDEGVVVWQEGESIARWSKGRTEVVIQSGRAPRINNDGHLFFVEFNSTDRTPDPFILKDGTIFAMADENLRSSRSNINSFGEVAWQVFAQDGSSSDIMLLRRVGNRFDFDGDCRVDMRDMRAMQICVNRDPEGQLLGDCTRGDGDGDQDVDLDDFEAFLATIAGPGTITPNCQ